MNEIKELKEKIEKEIKEIENKYGISKHICMDDYDSPIERLINLKAELKGINKTLSAISEDEIEFLKAIINHNWTIEQIKQEIGNRIKELKSQLQIPQTTKQANKVLGGSSRGSPCVQHAPDKTADNHDALGKDVAYSNKETRLGASGEIPTEKKLRRKGE
jgi:hypothetical protein